MYTNLKKIKFMYKIDRRGGGSKNRSIGNYPILNVLDIMMNFRCRTTVKIMRIKVKVFAYRMFHLLPHAFLLKTLIYEENTIAILYKWVIS